MRVLIVQNLDGTEPGQVGTALAEAGAEIDLRKPYRGDPLPENAAGHDALVVLGGAQSALDDDDYPYMPLLARAYGATNLLGAAPEFGWRGIAKTQEAATDPMLAAVPDAFTSFQWHDDTFTLPSGAVRLAANPAAENQAFRIGRATYGIQFHFEADRPMVSHWTKIFADYLAERHPRWAQEEEAATHGPAADAAGLALARAWISTIAAGAVRPKSAA
jgi:GMP synthase-like glutamine amidotransferase